MEHKNTNSIRYIIGILAAALLILLDQVTKQLAVSYLKGQSSFVLLKGVFELQYLENQGAAFGILQGKKVLFVLLTLVMAVFLLYVYTVLPSGKHFLPLQCICVLLFSGAIGNFIDRTLQNYVIDFFYFSLIDFPIFNVADIYVTCSVALFIILFLFYYKEADLDLLAALIFRRKDKKEQ